MANTNGNGDFFLVQDFNHVLGKNGLVICGHIGGLGGVAVSEEVWSDHSVPSGDTLLDLIVPVVAGARITVKEEQCGFTRLRGNVDVSVVGTV